MKYIVYLSTASIYFKPETLESMLVQFRKNNEATHITGMMLFSKGQFLQVLEGEDQDVDTLIKKIEKDRRHHSLIRLKSQPITERIFPDWSMGFKVSSPEDVKNIEGYVDLSDPNAVFLLQQDHVALNILKSFAEGMSLTKSA